MGDITETEHIESAKLDPDFPTQLQRQHVESVVRIEEYNSLLGSQLSAI